MEPHTRDILESCTDLLVDARMERVRRGFAVWQLNPEMYGGVAFQHQDFADGSVKIGTYPQVYWSPVQKIYALGNGDKYRAFQIPTRSRMWSFMNLGEPDSRFAPHVPPFAELVRLRGLIHDHVIPKVIDLADEDSILRFCREGVPYGGGRPELFMAISAWKFRTVMLDKEFDWVVSTLSHQQFIDRVTAFYERLRRSTDIAALLRG